MKKLILLCAFAVISLNSMATRIIVDQNGAGSFTTIQAGINAANTNDTVVVWPSTYMEQVTLNKNIVVQGSGYENTIITGNFNPTINISNGKLRWFMISSLSGDGVKISGGTLANCIIKGCSGNGVYANTGTGLIINCITVNNSSNGIYGDCGSAITVINCISRNNLGSGFNQYVSYYGCWAGFGLSYSNGSRTTYLGTQGNIDVDPLFISSTDYHIPSGSPCFNTGQPSIQDPDGSVSDMGYFGGPDCPIYPVVYEMIITPNGNNINVQAKARANY